jgi:hypothetical protein
VAENLSGIMVITHYDIRDTQVRAFIALLKEIGQGISTNAGSTKSHNIHRLSKETVTTLYSMSLATGLASRTVFIDGREVPVVAHYSSLGEHGAGNGYILLALEPDLAGTQLP